MARRSRPAQSAQRTRHPGEGALEGAALMVGHLVATPVIGRERLRRGTVGTEAGDPLPGDALVPSPNWSHTLGVAVDAPAEAVGPWIAQIGQGRGGFYTYQSLENLVGCRITNTTSILPEYQHPAVGDAAYLYPTGSALRAEVADPPHALVLFGSPADIGGGDSWGRSTWQFVGYQPSPATRDAARASSRPLRETIAACWQAGTLRPTSSVADPDTLAYMCWSAAHGLVSLTLAVHHPPTGAESVLTATATALLRPHLPGRTT